MKLNISGLLVLMRDQRKDLNLSQERVAEALRISKATLSEMESGHIAVGLERWLHWCAMLKLSPTDALKKWEVTEAFAEITKDRRNGFHRLVDNMIKYGFGFQLDSWMGFFNNLVEQEKRKRWVTKTKRQIKKSFPKVDA